MYVGEVSKEINFEDYIGPGLYQPVREPREKRGRRERVKLAIMEKGNLFGEDDAVLGRPYFATARCISTDGVLHVIKTHEFLRKFKEVDVSWGTIL